MKPFAPISANGQGSDPVTLIVGDMKRWSSSERELPVLEGLSFVDVNELSVGLIKEMNPDIILSPLVVRDTDAVEIAKTLYTFGYRGRYRVVADDIPDAELIRSEVSQAAPQLDFALISLPIEIFGA